MDKATADPLIGTTIAQYEVVARLGGGGMGIVYSARDTKLGRRVALKFLPPRWSHDESAKQRFIREAQAASATDHRNICTIHDIETASDGQLFIVMAHYDGQTLKQRLESGRLPIDDAVEIGAQVAEGLAKAHAQGVIHRDIKPGNLILTEDGVKILDFGLAKLAAESLRLTLEGTTIGTVAYMSPEQARGDEADPRADIWALGIVLYEMLAGVPPFRGHYAEAISHAIRHDTPAPLRTLNPDIPDVLERLVLHALQKDPTARIQTARELARDLRLLQGRTLPIDLRTEPLTAPLLEAARATHAARATTARGRYLRKAVGLAAGIAAVMIGSPLWLFSPVARVPAAVAPVVNQTGYAELDGYRLALTNELTAQLAESGRVRVIPYDRLLQIVRPFRQNGPDISSRDAIQAITTHSGAQVVIVPTLLYEGGSWKARVDLRNAGTATNVATYETASVTSSLPKDAAYGLIAPLAERIAEYFSASGPRRAYVADRMRTLVGLAPPASAPRMRTLDAVVAFEQGLDAYEQQEYADALQRFTTASQQDTRNPRLFAWRSRVARLMRRDEEAAESAEQAARLLTANTTVPDRLSIEAVVAESRRDPATAEARYRQLVERYPDDPTWLMELGSFQDRQTRFADAVESYVGALGLDPGLARPHLELCRLYGPTRRNEVTSAKEQAQQALTAYRALGARGGEAQALLCLTDVLRAGGSADRAEARHSAEAASKILDDLGSTYNAARAKHFLAMAAKAEGDLPGAVTFWEQSLAGARAAGNRGLEAAVLTNLGVTSEAVGNRSAALAYYQQAYSLSEALGDNQGAAYSQANAASILIRYVNPEEGFRNIQNALAVVRKLEDKNFEVFCLQEVAAYYGNAARIDDSERELNRARAIALERNLDGDVVSLTIDLGEARLARGQYADALAQLRQALGDGTGPSSAQAAISLARTLVRIGDFMRAQEELSRASAAIATRKDTGLLPRLHQALGELAYEAGRPREARTHFEAAAALWTDDLPDAASVEARAYLGLLDALDGRREAGRRLVDASVKQSQTMGRAELNARTRLFLARIDLADRRFDDAKRTLDAIPPDADGRTISPELRAQVHFWRGQALASAGDRTAGAAETALAKRVLSELRTGVPAPNRDAFTARPDLRAAFN